MKRLLLPFVLVGLVGCSGGKDPWAQQPGPKVLAYFPPLYSLAASVAGDDAQVISLISSTGPHHFEPTSRDALALRRADLFLTIGLGLDDEVAQKLTKTAGNPNLKLVELGESLPKELLHEGGCKCGNHEGHEHAHAHDHEHAEYDPHVWLGIPEAVRMVEGIRDNLLEIDPAHADGYKSRAAALVERLNVLLESGKAQLAGKEKPKLISFHGSLYYFARSIGAEVVDSIEAPGLEPSPKKLAKLVEDCKSNGVRIIAVEPQYPTKAAETIVRELKRQGIEATLVEIDPLETADRAELSPDYYERIMRQNVARLTAALK